MMKGDKRFIMALKDSSILNKKIKQATKGKAMVNYFFYVGYMLSLLVLMFIATTMPGLKDRCDESFNRVT